MATGHGYDSEGGRALAAAITSLMTGVAYRRSAELAAVVGTYAGYARNAEAHKRVMRKHQAANDGIRTLDVMDRDLHRAATKAWDEVVKLGEKNGFRNAQASLLAPTGTIGFMMDCDTTGIEPDFSLVKFKKLVGGGSMQIVNLTIPRALKKLGYQDEQIEAIVEYIADKGHVIDAPGLKLEHYEVFDTAMGERAISPMGHVRMMAAVAAVPVRRDLQDGQPAGVGHGGGDRGRLPAGLEARPQGDRGLPRQLQGRPAAVRRRLDRQGQGGRGGRSWRGQGREGHRVPPGAQAAAEAPAVADHVVHGRRGRGLPDRWVLPGRRPRRGVPQVRQAGLDPGRRDGRLLDRGVDRPAVRRAAGDLRREVHQPAVRAGRPDRRPGHPDGAVDDGLRLPPPGAGLPGLRDPRRSWASTPPTERARQLETGSYAPVAEESDEDLEDEIESYSQSAPVEKKAAAEPVAKPAEGAAKPAESQRSASGEVKSGTGAASAREVSAEVHSSAELMEKFMGKAADAPICMTCGTKMRPAGSCYVCEGCGSTSGCS